MNYKNYNDYELIYLVSENEDSFDILYDKYQFVINKVVCKYYRVLKEYNVDYNDIKQEADIAFFNSIKLYNSSNLFYTYLLSALNKSLFNYARKVFATKRVLNYDYVSLFDNVSNDNEKMLIDCLCDESTLCPEKNFLLKDFSNNLVMYKNNLSTEKSCIFDLVQSGFNNKEISILLDLEETRVRNLLYRMRKDFKKNFNFTSNI